MPGKSRRGRGKHIPRSKKRKFRPSSLAETAPEQVMAQPDKPISRPSAAPPPTSMPDDVATLTKTQHTNVIAELRRIGILAGIILVILVVLALVLS